jgi:hypothetical protein
LTKESGVFFEILQGYFWFWLGRQVERQTLKRQLKRQLMLFLGLYVTRENDVASIVGWQMEIDHLD